MQPLLHFFAGSDENNMSEYEHIFGFYEEHWNHGAEKKIVGKQTLTWEQVQTMQGIYSQCYFTDGEESKIEKLTTPNIFVFDCEHFFNNYEHFISNEEIQVKIETTTEDLRNSSHESILKSFPHNKIKRGTDQHIHLETHEMKTMSDVSLFTLMYFNTVNFLVSRDTVITVYGLEIHGVINEDDKILTNDESFAKIKQTFERLKDDMDATSNMSCTFMRIFRCAAGEKSKDGILENNMDIEVKKHAFEIQKDAITVYHSDSKVPVCTMTWNEFKNALHCTREFSCEFNIYQNTMIRMRLFDFKNIEAFLNCNRPRKKATF